MLEFLHYNLTFSNFLIYAICCLFGIFVLISRFYPAKYLNIPKTSCLKPQLYNVYFIKVVLTYYIVFHHILLHLGLWNRAYFCVEFFFIISGFLLIYTYQAQRTVCNFVCSKLLEFVPLIFFANILCLFSVERIDFLRFFSGIFLFASTNFYSAHTYYLPSWFLIILFWNSFLYFLIIKLLRASLHHIIIALITIISLIALLHTGNIESLNSLIPLTNGLLRGLAYMGIGYFLFIICNFQKFNVPHSNMFISLCEFLLFFMLFLFLFVKKYDVSSVFLVLTFCALLALFIFKHGYFSRLFEKKYWKTIAKVNIFIFMTHDIVIQALLHFRIFTFLPLPVRIFFIFLSCLLFGHLVYFTFSSAKRLHCRLYKND